MNLSRHIAIAATGLLAAASPATARGAFADVQYLYSLASPTGFIPFNGASLSYDSQDRELFVYAQGVVRVFNDSGMEIFTFGDSPELGGIGAVAPLEDGNLLALSFFDGKPGLARLNFRGELIERIELSGVPPEHAGFRPGTMRYRAGHAWLADMGGMRLMVVDASGHFEKFFDVAELVGEVANRESLGLRAFNVDPAGDALFTIQPLFKAYVLSYAGELKAFGKRGSAPGKFNVVSGIASDEAGNFYVTDILKSAVLVFDSGFNFVKEFGYRGRRPSSLAAPCEVEAGAGKIYVSQFARRGVSVFKVVDAPTG